MDHAHDLTCRAVAAVESGKAIARPQRSFKTSGDLYLTRDWTPVHMVRASLYLRTRYQQDGLGEDFTDQRGKLEYVQFGKGV